MRFLGKFFTVWALSVYSVSSRITRQAGRQAGTQCLLKDTEQWQDLFILWGIVCWCFDASFLFSAALSPYKRGLREGQGFVYCQDDQSVTVGDRCIITVLLLFPDLALSPRTKGGVTCRSEGGLSSCLFLPASDLMLIIPHIDSQSLQGIWDTC